MEPNDLIDLETYVALMKAAPRVTSVPFDAARMVVQGMTEFSVAHSAHVDPDGKKYWTAKLTEIHEAARMNEETAMITVGKSCRMMGLSTWRVGDGYHVAFSEGQLKILRERFKA